MCQYSKKIGTFKVSLRPTLSHAMALRVATSCPTNQLGNYGCPVAHRAPSDLTTANSSLSINSSRKFPYFRPQCSQRTGLSSAHFALITKPNTLARQSQSFWPRIHCFETCLSFHFPACRRVGRSSVRSSLYPHTIGG
jgi:hypothetical protein